MFNGNVLTSLLKNSHQFLSYICLLPLSVGSFHNFLAFHKLQFSNVIITTNGETVLIRRHDFTSARAAKGIQIMRINTFDVYLTSLFGNAISGSQPFTDGPLKQN